MALETLDSVTPYTAWCAHITAMIQMGSIDYASGAYATNPPVDIVQSVVSKPVHVKGILYWTLALHMTTIGYAFVNVLELRCIDVLLLSSPRSLWP